jgi:hypothetical protein
MRLLSRDYGSRGTTGGAAFFRHNRLKTSSFRGPETGSWSPFSALACCLLSIAFAIPATAQWIDYPTAGLPRTADGKPNLSAPAPRTADGKPDLSGLWRAEQDRPCDPEGCRDLPVSEQFFDLAFGRKEGPLPYRQATADLVKQRMADLAKDDPDSQCMPQGIIKMHAAPLMRKMVQTPNLMLILNERNAAYRQIFLDGRKLEADPNPNWRGYSTGRWEGDALVVESNGFRDDVWIDRHGSPISSAAKITEKFRRPNFGRLEVEVTVDDPKNYTEPWTVTMVQVLMPDTEMIDFYCLENERSVSHLVGQ